MIRQLIQFRTWAWIIVCVSLSSCASAPVQQPPQPPAYSSFSSIKIPLVRHDIMHTVGPGETLWRISKMYDVSIDEVMRVNHLQSKTKINMGQTLLVPNAAPLRPIIPLYASQKWQYIIVHHSATEKGDALNFNRAHLRRGFWNGLGYHFVIDNGTFGKEDGQIEVSPRWIKQQDGAHCKADDMNSKSIGICLVGNFSKESVSKAQMDALVHLVNVLKDYYNIPDRHILGHSQVPGAATECPGRRFPWKQFWARLHS